ncbi:hypothetical protein F9C07_2143945 [Aspergillus flavus]|uniref:Uncharacterized protein n=1 Tax=Aspergillus flavus (strain ATCC 200026 / FGSC A1120 / IAM 13836 / NRRL 3357 / JCM 12722 / SRRC 167) TaxID=332952 RepID=A0A7U2R1U2_ASPFN|nr:hypothetical protein AFLA_007610 [Aspergillus flavus NRRL3357]QRD91330.1 hypothetical protein F9C07_2143945 [Aspergillus flavus]
MKIPQRICQVVGVLDQRQSIPSEYEPIFEERIVLICNPLERLPRKATPRPKAEYKAHDLLKKARKIYLEVLERFPLVFVPFILAVSPASCQTWKASEMWRDLQGCKATPLSNNIYNYMERLAIDRGIHQTAVYKRIKQLLYPKAHPRPRTITETDECWTYNAASVDKVCKFLNERLYTTFDNSPKRLREKEENLWKTTHCIRMRFPWNNQQDAIVQLDMAFDCEIVQTLFPSAWDKFILVHGPIPLQDHAVGYPNSRQYDNASFTFHGAAVSRVSTILGSHIYQAIDESQLRKWETANFLVTTTDCITLHISRSQPHGCTLCLRVGSSHAVFMATRLYSFSG